MIFKLTFSVETSKKPPDFSNTYKEPAFSFTCNTIGVSLQNIKHGLTSMITVFR